MWKPRWLNGVPPSLMSNSTHSPSLLSRARVMQTHCGLRMIASEQSSSGGTVAALVWLAAAGEPDGRSDSERTTMLAAKRTNSVTRLAVRTRRRELFAAGGVKAGGGSGCPAGPGPRTTANSEDWAGSLVAVGYVGAGAADGPVGPGPAVGTRAGPIGGRGVGLPGVARGPEEGGGAGLIAS